MRKKWSVVKARAPLPRLLTIAIALNLFLGACGPVAPTPPAESPVPGETPSPPPTEPMPTVPPPPPRAEIKNPDSMIVADIFEPESLDPSYQYGAGYDIVFNVYETLVWWEREHSDQYVPVLATAMPTISDDGTTWTFTIREGITFHEGGELTPEDIAYSFWRTMIQDRAGGPSWLILEPLTGYYAMEAIAAQMGDQAACELVKNSVTYDNDTMTVTFHLPEPFGPFMDILASGWGVAMDKEWVADMGGWDGDCANWRDYHDPEDVESELYNIMNGTGPYKFHHWTPGEEIVLVRNDDYWLVEPLWAGGPSGPAVVERAVWKYVDEWGTRYTMFEAGDVDIVYVPRQYVSQADRLVREQWDAHDTSDPSKMTILNEDGIARSFVNLPGTFADDVVFNFNVQTEGGNIYIGSGELDGNGIPPDFFSDIHVRQAFNYCFDFNAFINDAWLGEAIQRRGPIISGMPGFNPDQEVFTYDLERCEEEFRAAWDGQLWDNGFFFVIAYIAGHDDLRTAAEIIEANVEGVNPKFSIGVLDLPYPTYLDEVMAARLPLAVAGWVEDYHHPHSWVFPYMSSSGTFAHFQGLPQEMYDRYDPKIAECLGLPFAPQAEVCYRELQAMAIEDVIDIFMVQATRRHYEQLWVNGYYYNPAYPTPMWAYRFQEKGY